MTVDQTADHVKQHEQLTPESYFKDMRELTVFFELMVEQINMMLQESGESVDALTDSVSSIAASISAISEQTGKAASGSGQALGSEADCRSSKRGKDGRESQTIAALSAEAEWHISRAITAVQFYDRLSQRLLHVQENLQALSEITSVKNKRHEELWQELHARMRSVYTLEQEQELYSKLLTRLAVEDGESVQIVMRRDEGGAGREPGDSAKPAPHGDIELF